MAMSGNEDSNVAHYVFEAGELTTRDLLILQIEGEEAVSRMFEYRMLLASEDRHILPEDLVGKPGIITVMMNPNVEGGGHPDDPDVARYISGIVNRFKHLRDGNTYSYYEVELVPTLWLLKFREKSRIFQKKNVQEIITEVFSDAGIPENMYEFSLNATYPPREYCVQYRESEWDFIQRLLEEEGIFYYFKHTYPDHMLVMGDTPQVNVPIVGDSDVPCRHGGGMVSTEEVIQFELSEEIRTGKVTLRDFEYTKPVPPVEAEEKTELNEELEHYDYPAQYVSEDEKTAAETGRLAKTRLEEFQTTRIRAKGRATCRRFAAGSTFNLTEHSRDTTNQVYLITKMRVAGYQPQAAIDEFAGDLAPPGPDYMCDFDAIPHSVTFRPARVTRKPVVRGSQTAIVVGPSSEEIYTDEHGRAKVHFHWDRQGEFNENDSCWIRVSQGWAGGQYGSIFLPRIGQEVIVDFLEGDPDQPIITGRVFNGDHKPPYPLPAEKTKSTIRTSSSLDGGGANELRFEDKKGSEQIFLHAQKDLHIRALNDRVVNIEKHSHETVGKSHREVVKGSRSRQVGGKEAIKIKDSRSIVVDMDVLEEYGMNQLKSVGLNYHTKASMEVHLEAGMALTLKGPGGHIRIDPAGVTIKGNMIWLEGSLVYINSGSGMPPGSFTAPSPVSPASPAKADTESPGHDVDYTGKKAPHVPLKLKIVEEKTWLKISLEDDEGNPVPGEPYSVVTKDGSKIDGTLDVNGEASLMGLAKDDKFKITFPRLDGGEWEKG